MPDIEVIVRDVISSKSERFVELASIAKLRPDRSFRHANLSGISFAGQDLRGFDFTGADLSGCNFVGARLTGVDFTDAKLDDEAQEAILLALELAKPAKAVLPLEPDIYVSLVQEADDFIDALRTLRALEAADHIPSNCFIRVLELAANETAALQVFEFWQQHHKLDDFAIVERLCGRLTSRAAAEVAVERFGNWENMQPQELIACLGSIEAKLSAVAKLAGKGLLSNEVLNELFEWSESGRDLDRILEALRLLNAESQINFSLARFIATTRSFHDGMLIFQQLASWNEALSNDHAARILMSLAESTAQAAEALSVGSKRLNETLFLEAAKRLPISDVRKLASSVSFSFYKERLLTEVMLRPALKVADLLHVISLSVELEVPYPRSAGSSLVRARPVFSRLLALEANLLDKKIWKKAAVECRDDAELVALNDLRDLLDNGFRIIVPRGSDIIM